VDIKKLVKKWWESLCSNIMVEEVELFGLVSTILGVALFIIACFWDSIAGIQIHHHEG
jgi:hypothetical protein